MTPTTWVYGGVTFYGYEHAATGVFVVREWGGVNDAPAVRTTPLPRPRGNGDFPLPTTRGPRFMPGAGWCRAADEAGLLTLRNQFISIADGGDFVINEFGVSRTSKAAEIYGTPTFKRQGSSLRAEWTLMLRAVDPLLYDNGAGDGHL